MSDKNHCQQSIENRLLHLAREGIRIIAFACRIIILNVLPNVEREGHNYYFESQGCSGCSSLVIGPNDPLLCVISFLPFTQSTRHLCYWLSYSISVQENYGLINKRYIHNVKYCNNMNGDVGMECIITCYFLLIKVEHVNKYLNSSQVLINRRFIKCVDKIIRLIM